LAAVGNSLTQGSSALPDKVSAPTLPAVAHDQKDHPNIRFWKKTDWTEFCSNKKSTAKGNTATKLNEPAKPRGKTRISESDENVNDQYLEKEDGSTMGGTEAAELRALLRCIFSEQKKTDAENMPPSWGSAAMSFRNFVFQQVYLKFPCLQLCRSDWKVSQIAGTTYSSWKTHGKQRTKPETVKDELSDVKMQATEELNPTSSNEPARAATPPAKRPFVPEDTVSKSLKRACIEASSERY
jgi:hypothetical protein